jgi:hypothetical protein
MARTTPGTRTPPNPKKSTKLSILELQVRNAEANGGGWVQFVFHRLCEQCGPYAITLPSSPRSWTSCRVRSPAAAWWCRRPRR